MIRLLLFLALFGPFGRLLADPIISEFMASNVTTLKDGHDKFEDWIEIWNPDAAPVNLAGWRLTDNAGSLSKFVFPSKVLSAGGRLIVFASNRTGSTGAATHIDPLGYLHTNFSLSKDGEYLALLRPDGAKTSEFAPKYPAQIDDLSFGSPGATETLVGSTTPLRYRVPANTGLDSASPNWLAANYTETGWTAATGSGVGFEAGALTGAWKLDEAAGATSAADASGSGLTAALNGTGQTFGTAGHAALTNTSITLNGGGGLTVPYVAKLNPTTEFTFAAWVYPTAASGVHQAIVSSRVGVSESKKGYILYITPSPASTWEFWTGSNQGAGVGWQTIAGPAVTFNTWTHVAITRDPAGLKRLYINGVAVSSATQGYAPNDNPANGFHLGVGEDTGSNFKFSGRIDDVAFWSTDIGAAQVVQHRDQSSGFFPTALYSAHFQNNVQLPMYGVNPGIYTRHNFTVGALANYFGLRLRVKFDDAFVAYLNGVEIARRNFTGTRAYNSVADTDRQESSAVVYEDIDVTTPGLPALQNGPNTLAVHGMTHTLGGGDFLLTPVLEGNLSPAAQAGGYFADATPGAANSATTVAPGPGITLVAHMPLEPAAGQAITVTANLTPRLAGIASASLKYRVMYGGESSIAMVDAGPLPGATDGSRIYTGTIPGTHGATARQMLRYAVTATDAGARGWRAPYVVDLTNDDGDSQSPEYFGLVIRDAAVIGGMPILQWFTNDVTNSDTRVGSRGSAYYGGRFYDNIYIRQRGGFTSTGSQKFNFNRGDNLFVNVTLGNVGEVNMNSSGQDTNFYRVAAAYDLYRTAGHPACEAFSVAMYRNGAYQRMATLVEQVDEDYLQRWGFDPRGALYKFVQRTTPAPIGGNDYSNGPAFLDTVSGVEKKTREFENFADLDTFITNVNGGTADTRKAYLYKTLNLPNYVNFMAMRSLLAEEDVNRKNFYFYRDTEGTLEWYLLPWDKDLTMGIGYNTDPATNRPNPWQATNTYKHEPTATRQWSVLWEQGYQSLEIRAMVGRRLRTLMDEMMGSAATPAGTSLMEQRMAAVRAAMLPLPAGASVSGTYNDLTSWTSWLGSHRNALFNTYGPSSGFGMIPTAATVAGNVAIAAVDPNPASGTQTLEYLQLINNNAEAVDLTRWSLTGGGINHVFPAGTVLPGTAVTATLNRAFVCNDRGAFRARAGAPTTAEFVLGNYDGQLTARGGVVALRNAAGVLVSSVTLPTAPTPAQQQLRITKVMYAPLPPSSLESSLVTGVEAGDFEYVELLNIGAAALDLSGARFTDGIEFTFAPGTSLAAGQRIMVVSSTAAFDARYGTGLNRVGPFTGSLDNAGERLRIVDAVGEEVLDFTYDPAWFPASLSAGYALVVCDPVGTSYANWTLPETWALSGTPGGRPGEAPTFFSAEYAGWRNYHFTAVERANPAVSGGAAVLNSAGLSNALAYVLNLDPRRPDLGLLPSAVLVADGGETYAALRFRRWKHELGSVVTAEVNGDLTKPAEWTAVAVVTSVVDNGDSTETVTIRDSVPASGNRRFLRLHALVP
jgi:hypothetical protein